MAVPSVQQMDLAAWLSDLKKVGGKARTLAERRTVTETFMDMGDLQMLEEATKRIIVAISKKFMYEVPLGTQSGRMGSIDSPPQGTREIDVGRSQLRSRPSPSYSGDGGDRPNEAMQPTGVRPHGIIGSTGAMHRVHHLIDKAAACSLPVLIQGESGTGKELVARAVHDHSNRQSRRFFSENCSALSESLLESELFGHVRGAFTGADRDRKGILELADGGTLFLDEIGDMSLRMQSKLLRALQEREFRPVGGREMIRVDVRIISATNRRLSELIKEGEFREDLFYRINVVTISLPTLNARKADIPSLTNHFLDRIAVETGLPRKEFSSGALELLAGYDWPGNIRELENVVQRAVALSEELRIETADLPDKIRHVMITEESPNYSSVGKGGEQLMIEKALHNFEGDKTRASRFIGWSRPKLYRRMRVYGIPIDFARSRAKR